MVGRDQLPIFPAPGRDLETKGLNTESHAHNILGRSLGTEGTPDLVNKCITAGPQGCLTSELPLWSPASKSQLQPTHTYIMWHVTKSQFKQLINFLKMKFKLKHIMALISVKRLPPPMLKNWPRKKKAYFKLSNQN